MDPDRRVVTRADCMKVYGSTLLALQVGGCVFIFQEKSIM